MWEKLLAETRRELAESGYGGLNIRRIAQNCGTATGTLYNYFASKEMLVASAMLDDWLGAIGRAGACLRRCESVADGFEAIYGAIIWFTEKYSPIFHENAIPLAGGAYTQRHIQLRGQIASLIIELTERFGSAPEPTALAVIAEALLAGAAEDWSFAELFAVIQKLL